MTGTHTNAKTRKTLDEIASEYRLMSRNMEQDFPVVYVERNMKRIQRLAKSIPVNLTSDLHRMQAEFDLWINRIQATRLKYAPLSDFPVLGSKTKKEKEADFRRAAAQAVVVKCL